MARLKINTCRSFHNVVMLAALKSETHFSFHNFTALTPVHFRMHSTQQ